MWTWFHKLASPPHAFRMLTKLRPWLLWPAVAAILWSAYMGLFVVPVDYQQGDAFRMIYFHVPSASMSLTVYSAMALAAGIGIIWRLKLAHAVASGCAAIGAWFTFLALVTGSIWGKPMWGTWWEWDPRLTSELILLFFFLGYLALRSSYDDIQRADRASGLLAVVGIVNVPIVKYSVEWWNSLHQGPSLSVTGSSAIDSSMVAPLLVMMLGFLLFFGAILCDRVKVEILKRERNASWLEEAQ